MICYDTLVWTSENIGAYGEDSKDISVCGDRLAFSVLVRYNTMQVKVQATGQAK